MSQLSSTFPTIPCPYKEEEGSVFTLTLTFFEGGVLIVTRDAEKIVFEKYISYPFSADANLSSTLGELVYAYPFLTYNYRWIDLYFYPKERVVVPTHFSDLQCDAYWLATIAAPSDASYVGSFEVYPLGEVRVVATWDKESLNFLRRTYSGVLPLPLTVASLRSMHKKSLMKRQRIVHILVENSQIELSMYQGGGLLFSNAFDSVSHSGHTDGERLSNEVLFFWTAMCKSLSIESVVGDEVMLFLTPDLLVNRELVAELRSSLEKIFQEMGTSFSIHSYSYL